MKTKKLIKVINLEVNGDKFDKNNENLFWVGNTAVGKGCKQNRRVLDYDIKAT